MSDMIEHIIRESQPLGWAEYVMIGAMAISALILIVSAALVVWRFFVPIRQGGTQGVDRGSGVG